MRDSFLRWFSSSEFSSCKLCRGLTFASADFWECVPGSIWAKAYFLRLPLPRHQYWHHFWCVRDCGYLDGCRCVWVDGCVVCERVWVGGWVDGWVVGLVNLWVVGDGWMEGGVCATASHGQASRIIVRWQLQHTATHNATANLEQKGRITAATHCTTHCKTLQRTGLLTLTVKRVQSLL